MSWPLPLPPVNNLVGDDLRRLLGREPTTLRTLSEDYRWQWRTETWT